MNYIKEMRFPTPWMAFLCSLNSQLYVQKMCKQSLGYIKIYMSGAVCNKISREKTFENALSNSVDCPLCCHIELNCFMTFDV